MSEINGRADPARLLAGRLAADQTNATTTMAAVTGLTVNVQNGRKYAFRVVLFLVDSTAADGVKVDFDASTATATDFRAHAVVFDTVATALIAQATALATDHVVATLTGSALMEINGTFEPSADGTFAVRAAQNAHTAGTLTVARGSFLQVWDVT